MESSNWQTKTIAELGNFSPTTVQTGPFGSQLHSDDYVEEGIPLILIRNIGDNGLTGDLPKITEEDAKRLARYSLLPGDIVFSRVGRVGSCFLATEENRGWIISGQTLRIRLAYNEVDPNYLIYAIRNKASQDFISGSSVGSTRSSINTSILESLPVNLPPLKHQQKIAEVLATIDRAIAQTEALIAKHQRIKTGLMQDLLTRGIDEHGQLRDPSTHRFKSTPLGMIPEEWEVKTVDELCYDVCVGIVIKPTQYYVEDGVPALRSANVQVNHINSDNLVYISEKSNKLLAKSMLREGYVVSVRTGYPGTSAVVSKEFDEANCIDLIISKPKPELLPKYLSTWVNSAFGKDQVLKAQGGLAQQHFNVGEMKNLVVCKPNEDEQARILKVLDNQDLLISNEEDRLKKLLRTKAGLMQDLLSGRVSVKGLVEGENQ